MTHEEVMAMSVKELRIKAAELDGWDHVRVAPELCGHVVGHHPRFDVKRAGWDLVPDYPYNIAAAWELFEAARSGPDFWGFVQALEALCDDPEMAMRDAPIPTIQLLGHLSPGLITRAFVLAKTQKEANS